jgi:hypothetical protein
VSSEPLYRVELCALSEGAKRELADLIDERVRAALADLAPKKPHREGLTFSKAAAYLGVAPSTFHEMLKKHQDLADLAYVVGKKDRRWRKVDLDRWVDSQVAKSRALKDAA